MRRLIIMLLLLAFGIALYLAFRSDGLLEKVTENRVEEALVANGAPLSLATCMAGRLVDDLTLEQLRKLEALAPREGEDSIPRSTDAALDRVKRVDDPQAVRALGTAGVACSISILREQLNERF